MTTANQATHPPLASTLLVMTGLGQAILYRPSLSSMGSLRLERIGRLRNRWQHMPVQGRPTIAASGRGASATVHLIDENRPGAGEEMERRFARDLVAWIREHAIAPKDSRTVVFAPPHFLGRLREVPAEGLELLHGDLTNLSPSALAQHASVLEALPLAQRGEGAEGPGIRRPAK